MTLHLVLTFHWFDEMIAGRKHIEYRRQSPHWKRLVWDRRKDLEFVRFRRGYTGEAITRRIEKIDKGRSPIPGWIENYYRLHLGPIIGKETWERG